MISERLKKVIFTELELDGWEIDDGTTAGSVPGWDSLSHARIISAIEDDYNIRFSTNEILQLKNIGQLQFLIDTKTK
jgi:acyl carrier protein